MTAHARPLSDPTGAPDALGLATRMEGLFLEPSKNLGGRPRGSLSRPVRSAKSLRAPEPGETPLSAAEIRHGIEIRAFSVDVAPVNDETDLWPLVRRIVPAGSWGIKAKGLRRAGPFDGLTA